MYTMLGRNVNACDTLIIFVTFTSWSCGNANYMIHLYPESGMNHLEMTALSGLVESKPCLV